MKDAEPGKTFSDLCGRHCGSVIAHGGTRETTLLQCLRQAMGDVLGGLNKIPLQVTSQPRVIVEYAEQHRCHVPRGVSTLREPT